MNLDDNLHQCEFFLIAVFCHDLNMVAKLIYLRRIWRLDIGTMYTVVFLVNICVVE